MLDLYLDEYFYSVVDSRSEIDDLLEVYGFNDTDLSMWG